MKAEDLARVIHSIYEETAPEFGHGARRLPVPGTGRKSGIERQPVPWDRVPQANQEFLTELAARLLNTLLSGPTDQAPGATPAHILIRALHDHARGIFIGGCVDIAEAQLEALTDGGYLIVPRSDARLAWSWAIEALDGLPAEHLPDQPHLQRVDDALTRLYTLLTFSCPARRADSDSTDQRQEHQ